MRSFGKLFFAFGLLAAAVGCGSPPEKKKSERELLMDGKRAELQKLLRNPPALATEAFWEKEGAPGINAAACAAWQKCKFVESFFRELPDIGLQPVDIYGNALEILPGEVVTLADAIAKGHGELNCGAWPSHAELVADTMTMFREENVPPEWVGPLRIDLRAAFIRELKGMARVALADIRKNPTAMIDDQPLLAIRPQLAIQGIRPQDLGINSAQFDRIFYYGLGR